MDAAKTLTQFYAELQLQLLQAVPKEDAMQGLILVNLCIIPQEVLRWASQGLWPSQ